MKIGTSLNPSATRVMLPGAGKSGKEIIIALQRLGVEVIAVDRYANAPGHQVAHRAHVINMADGAALRTSGASAVIYGGLEEEGIAFEGVGEALRVPQSGIRLFGKPESFVRRRMGVALANADTIGEARKRAKLAASKVKPVKG